MTKREIWVSDIPAKGGHVRRGYQPALIAANATQSLATVIPITSSLSATRFPYTLAVSPTENNGLDKPSVLLMLQLDAVDTQFLHRSIGRLDAATLRRVDEQLKSMLQLP
jgi:mRNA-degrading endonuclease toxin of MazEF toxin-antitoxin module